ncbi:MAG: MAPEG family protein [Alphaproteobacteria bacterium]|nr:MAPEG family protein [Alphaproteobacteria bacterium]
MPLIDQVLIVPLFIHVLLVFSVAFRMYRARVAAYKAGEVQLAEIALDNSKWPEKVRKLQNNLSNQFETPPLFGLVIAFALLFGLKSWVFVVLAWLYILSRLAHSYIHTGSNYIPHRIRAFGTGLVLLLLMWVFLFVHIFLL